jgi:hypothetical protein
MAPVPVGIVSMPGNSGTTEEITFLDDVDYLSSTEVMLGCGNDNPY